MGWVGGRGVHGGIPQPLAHAGEAADRAHPNLDYPPTPTFTPAAKANTIRCMPLTTPAAHPIPPPPSPHLAIHGDPPPLHRTWRSTQIPPPLHRTWRSTEIPPPHRTWRFTQIPPPTAPGDPRSVSSGPKAPRGSGSGECPHQGPCRAGRVQHQAQGPSRARAAWHPARRTPAGQPGPGLHQAGRPCDD